MERTSPYTARPGFVISKDGVASPYYQIRSNGNVLFVRDGELVSEVSLHELQSPSNCPLCHREAMRSEQQKKFGLFPKCVLLCTNVDCGATFTKSAQGYTLSYARNKTDHTWLRYGKQTLTLREWETIERGGMSDAEQKKLDIAQWLDNLRKGKVELNSNASWGHVFPQQGEQILYAFPTVTMREPRSIRRSSGVYGGPSFRVAKGVYLRTGGFGSTSESHSEIRNVDAGTFTVTDRRIVFSGLLKTLNIDFPKIIEIEGFGNGIALRRSTSQKTQYFVWPAPLPTISITTNGKTYSEPFSGLILQSLIEGLIQRKETVPSVGIEPTSRP
jgi:hypothetical protein